MKRLLILSLMVIQLGFAFDSTIPVVDMQDYYNPETRDSFVQTVGNALKELGFFAVVNPGVDIEALDNAYNAAKAFFNQSLDAKFQCHDPEINGQRGYVPGESAKGQTFKDFKEFYHVGRELSGEELANINDEKNIWPETMNLKDPTNTLFKALEKHMIPIQEAIALAIGQPKGFFTEKTVKGNSLLRAIHYPASPPSNRIWAAEHTDINLFTILPRATADGLQVKNKKGKWITIKVPDNAFIINCGDQLQHITNGEFRSGPHRVVSMGENYERYSMVFFVHPRSFDDMSPLPACIERTGGKALYSKATTLEILSERLADLGIASPSLLKYLGESGFLERQIDMGKASPEAMVAVRDAGYASEKVLDELAKLNL